MANRLLLTGASGFIGTQLTRLVSKEWEDVRVLAQNESESAKLREFKSVQVILGDLTASDSWVRAVETVRPDLCVHLAWITTPGVYLKSPENARLAESTIRLAQILAETGCRRFVGVGTCFEYDTDVGTLAETTPNRPSTPYAEAKLGVFRKLSDLAEKKSMSFAWPRLFYLYGPNEHPNRLVPTLIHSFLNGTPASLTSGDKVRDYLHVEDVAAGIWAVAKSNLTGPVNVGSGRPVTLAGMVDILSKIFNSPGSVAFGTRPDDPLDPRFVLADITKLQTGTGWSPRYSLEEGLRRTVEWWKDRMAVAKQ